MGCFPNKQKPENQNQPEIQNKQPQSQPQNQNNPNIIVNQPVQNGENKIEVAKNGQNKSEPQKEQNYIIQAQQSNANHTSKPVEKLLSASSYSKVTFKVTKINEAYPTGFKLGQQFTFTNQEIQQTIEKKKGITWGIQSKKTTPEILFPPEMKNISREHLLFYIRDGYYVLQDTAKNTSYFQVDKDEKLEIYKDKMIEIKQGNKVMQLYIEDASETLTEEGNKASLQQVISLKFIDIQITKKNTNSKKYGECQLVVSQPGIENSRQTFPITQETIKIGKSDKCQIKFPNCDSDELAEIGFIKGEGWYIQPLTDQATVLQSLQTVKMNKTENYYSVRNGVKVYIEGFVFESILQ